MSESEHCEHKDRRKWHQVNSGSIYDTANSKHYGINNIIYRKVLHRSALL